MVNNKNKIIARLLLSTKRKKRLQSIEEVACDINSLLDFKLSLDEISKLVGISKDMLRQFLRFYKLDEKVKEEVRKRNIDSVSMINQLSKFDSKEQWILAKNIIEGNIRSSELKFLYPLRKQYPNSNINALIKKLKNSQNIKLQVIQLDYSLEERKLNKLESLLREIISASNIHSVKKEQEKTKIYLFKNGVKELREFAKKRKLSLNELVKNLVAKL